DQYKALVELADGFDLDGFRMYGIEKHGDYENDLFTYNGYCRVTHVTKRKRLHTYLQLTTSFFSFDSVRA
ncbi:hypothetical protein LXP63_21495, partial [Yersinia pestis subsp. pestis]|nr:hypothetical protein [Yersinia pestis subsp. pestis]